MANRNKNKGTYHEKWFVEKLNEANIEAKRVPLSGSLGGEYSGDIHLYLNGQKLVGEVKYRDKSNFPSPYKVLEGRDIAFYKRRTGSPQSLVIMTFEQFITILENKPTEERFKSMVQELFGADIAKLINKENKNGITKQDAQESS